MLPRRASTPAKSPPDPTFAVEGPPSVRLWLTLVLSMLALAKVIVVATAVLLVIAALAYSAAAPPRILLPWATLGALQLGAWAILSLRLLPKIPSRAADPAFWRRAGKVVALGNNVVVVAGIWLLSPY